MENDTDDTKNETQLDEAHCSSNNLDGILKRKT